MKRCAFTNAPCVGGQAPSKFRWRPWADSIRSVLRRTSQRSRRQPHRAGPLWLSPPFPLMLVLIPQGVDDYMHR